MSVSELYAQCVGLGGMSPEYFKKELRPYEAEHYIEGVMMRKRDGWEQARLIVSPWSGKDSQPLVFPWEQSEVAEPTLDEIEDVRQWAEALNLNKHG